MKIVVFMGLTASGKTTIGKLLAKSLSWYFIDLDERIAEKTSMSVRSFYEKYGKKAFQEMEEKSLKECLELEISDAKPLIVSVGGGLIENANAVFTLQKKPKAQIFFLHNKPKILFNRILKKAKKEHSFPAFLKACSPKDLHSQIKYARVKYLSICKKRMKLLSSIDYVKVKTKGLNAKKLIQMLKREISR